LVPTPYVAKRRAKVHPIPPGCAGRSAGPPKARSDLARAVPEHVLTGALRFTRPTVRPWWRRLALQPSQARPICREQSLTLSNITGAATSSVYSGNNNVAFAYGSTVNNVTLLSTNGVAETVTLNNRSRRASTIASQPSKRWTTNSS